MLWHQIFPLLKYPFKKILPSSLVDKLKAFKLRSKIKLWYIKHLATLVSNYTYDLKRFIRWSAVGKQNYTQDNLRALITMNYHRLEKGLAFKKPRVGFGARVVRELVSYLHIYQRYYGFDETCQIALNTLLVFYKFNKDQGFEDEQLHRMLITFKALIIDLENATCQGGVKEVIKRDILSEAKLDLRDFFNSRHSIRHFSSDDVDINLITQAIAMAQNTPSVCNRQSSKVYVFNDYESKQSVLSCQNGNRGFEDQISKVLIVTSNIENFVSVGERNQCWIDGGMYAMSLVYALHSLGLGTCCLNCSIERQVDQKLRQVARIPQSEAIIMMIAVGHLPEKFKVAQSPRKGIDEVLIIRS